MIQPQKSSHFLIDFAVRDNLFYYEVDLEDPPTGYVVYCIKSWSRQHWDGVAIMKVN